MNTTHAPTMSAGRMGTLAVAVFLTVFATRAALIHFAGSPLPHLDEWDALGRELLPAWSEQNLDWTRFTAPHNEHRIAFTRAQEIALVALTGAWEPTVSMVLNAVWMGLAAAILTGVLLRRFDGAARGGLAVFIALVFAAPHAWQNTLWAFQSQNMFQLLCGACALILWSHRPTTTATRCGGSLCAGLGLFSSGAGLLAPLAAAATFLLLASVHRNQRRADLWRTVHAVALLAFGFWLGVNVPRHAPLQATSLVQFGEVFLRGLAWPGMTYWFLAPVLWLPWVLLLVGVVRRTLPRHAGTDLVLALGAWSLAHAAAIAWSRGGGLPDDLPLSRYLDGFVPGAIANAAALAWLGAARPGNLVRALRVAWIVAFAGGLAWLTHTNLTLHLPFKIASNAAQLENLQHYVATRDFAALSGKTAAEIGHPDPMVIARVLDDARLHALLPAALRPTAARRSPALRVVEPILPQAWIATLAATAALLLLALRTREPPAR